MEQLIKKGEEAFLCFRNGDTPFHVKVHDVEWRGTNAHYTLAIYLPNNKCTYIEGVHNYFVRKKMSDFNTNFE